MDSYTLVSTLFGIAFGVTYLGAVALHFFSTYYFFNAYGFVGALIAFVCPVLSTVAAMVFELWHGNYGLPLFGLTYLTIAAYVVGVLYLATKPERAVL